LDYKNLYEDLYQLGYQKDINIGVKYIDWIISHYPFNSILDVGCAQGIAVQRYQEKGKDAYGIDVAPTAIELSKERKIKNCFVASATKIPFDDSFFDVVTTSDVLEHLTIEDVPLAIKEMIRVSKRLIFLRVSKFPENNRTWINKIQYKYPNIENLHLTIKPYHFWIKQFTTYGNCRYIKRFEKILVFEKK